MSNANIVRNNPVYAITPNETHVDKEGYGVVMSSGKAAICTSASVHPYGVILNGEATTGKSSVMCFTGNPAPVRVKLDGTPGTVVQGTLLAITATGTFIADATSGARVLCAQAQESGAADELISATLFKPVSLS